MLRLVKGIYKFSRLSGTLGISVSYTLLGVLVAIAENHTLNSGKIALLFIANEIAVISTFMINDIEDADEDREDIKKRVRNPVSSGLIKPKEGYIITWTTIMLAAILYWFINNTVLLIGVSIIIVGYIYSWKRIRLKIKPPLDIISHLYFLGIAITITVYASVGINSINSALMLVIIALTSINIEINNGIRDYQLDIDTNVKTSVGVLGLKKANYLRIFNYFLVTIAGIYLLLELFLV